MQLQPHISFEIRELSNLIRRDMKQSFPDLPQKPPKGIHGWAINYFYENRDRDIFQRDFEKQFSIRRSTASNILKLMEKNGYIKRVSVENDARLKKIVLTEEAARRHEQISADIERREAKLRRGLSEEEIDIFFAIMQKLKTNMGDPV